GSCTKRPRPRWARSSTSDARGASSRRTVPNGRPRPDRVNSTGSMSTRVVETRSRKLRVLEAEAGADPAARPQMQPKPPWIRMKMPTGEVFFDLKKRVAELGLHTVCEIA